jgi:hypothetical protein
MTDPRANPAAARDNPSRMAPQRWTDRCKLPCLKPAASFAGVGHDHASVAELLAQHAGEDLPVHGSPGRSRPASRRRSRSAARA